MTISKTLLQAWIGLGAAVLTLGVLPSASQASSASLQLAPTATPIFMQDPATQVGSPAWSLPPQSTQRLGPPPLGTSVFPVTPDEFCSTYKSDVAPSCSVSNAGTRCSSAIDDGPFCSTFALLPKVRGACSTFGAHAACSALQPATTSELGVSGCSVLGATLEFGASRCSALGGGLKEACSVENWAFAPNACSVFGDNGVCSTLNRGASFRSNCSAFYPGMRQTCSTHDGFGKNPQSAACSVLQESYGTCTALQGASVPFCSAHAGVTMPSGGMGHCSVIHGRSGSYCHRP